MREYKGYKIEQITKKDWMIKDANGETVRTADDRPTAKTLKEAKDTIDRITENKKMKNIKEAFEEYERTEKEIDAIDEAYEENPEDAEIEAAWTKAYEAWHEASETLISEIEKLANGAIDRKTIRAMLATKREEIKALIERAA